MLELSKKILDKYQVRKTKKQKTEFINFLKQELSNYKVEVEEGGMFKSRNIIVGDLENCKIVLGAHYDTQPVLPFPNFLTPKNKLAYFLYTLLFVICLLTVTFSIGIIVTLITNNSDLGTFVSELFYIFLIIWMLVGKANKHTANDNTSGVLTLIEALHEDELKDVCCVFFDHEEIGLFGSRFFYKKHKDSLKNKLFFNFDCVGDGDTIMLILSDSALQEENKLKESFVSSTHKEAVITEAKNTRYPSDQMNFKHYVGVAAFKKNKLFGYYMDKIHTVKDTTCDENNIEFIIKGLKEYIKKVD